MNQDGRVGILTHRMGDEAATPALHFEEDLAGHQTGSGAAQDHFLPHKTLDVLKDALLDLKLLKYALLGTGKDRQNTGNILKRLLGEQHSCRIRERQRETGNAALREM
ncbi:hypothetical protein EYF80_028901 [Liparis tanakae]|uniref:Uncharacterized protein n=1 Tax=Liparis tanakae TaxID=230148 RepID=A0A4Z2H5C3_9TELE|nr:hypothetical protein EYF80_028901 [Liparis tanakae]